MLNWQEAYRKSIRSFEQLNAQLGSENCIPEVTDYPILIPQRILKNIRHFGIDSALGKQFLPHEDEMNQEGKLDPIGDKKNAKGNGIIHRYRNRILFTPTINCPILCRYCFRKNELTNKDSIFNQNLKALVDTIKSDPKINEVILTGGDPLILSTKKLRQIADLLLEHNIPFLRIHTRTPVILPERIDFELLDFLTTYKKLFSRLTLVLHTNHNQELDQDVCIALEKISNCNIQCLTQSVLLKGVNNNSQSLLELFNRIIQLGFTPYYLHHPDQAKGAMHFYLSLEEGRKIYNKLRQDLPGWAIPHYIIDHPSGQGKQFAFNPESIAFSGKLLNSHEEEIDYI